MPAALMRRSIAMAGLAALTMATPARADCPVPKSSTTCDSLKDQTFSPDQLAAFSPNQSFHVMPRLIGVADLAGPPVFRGAGGAGVLAGWSPLGDQTFRLWAGADLLAGQWSGTRLGGFTFEPKLRADYRFFNNDFLGVAAFGQGILPIFSKVGVAGGGGLGLSASVINRVMLDLGYDIYSRPNDFTVRNDTRTYGDRVTLALGTDLVADCSSRSIPPTTQTVVDLRCEILRTAVDLAPKPEVCKQILASYLSADFSVAEPEATRDFIKSLPDDLQTALSKPNKASETCVNQHKNLQRECFTCTSKRWLRWYTYEIDPRQILAALGCIEGQKAREMLCDRDAADLAKRYAPKCD